MHAPAQVLGVCGPSPVSPGWLVLSVTVGALDVQPLKVRQDNVNDSGTNILYFHVPGSQYVAETKFMPRLNRNMIDAENPKRTK